MNTHKRKGRPSMRPTEPFWNTDLHKVLVKKLKHVPGVVVNGRIVMRQLAIACDVVPYSAYRWFSQDQLPQRAANRLIQISKGKVTREDLFKFILR